MQTRTIYEEAILKDMQGLPETAQEKMAKLVHFLKREIIQGDEFRDPVPGSAAPDEKTATDEFLSVCGTWEDDRDVEKQIQDIYSSRKSTLRTEGI